VYRNEKRLRIAPEDALSAVAMVHIEVNDCYSAEVVTRARPSDPDRNIVKNAKSTRGIAHSVVSRRTNRTKCI
jgi:hypothetical protein